MASYALLTRNSESALFSVSKLPYCFSRRVQALVIGPAAVKSRPSTTVESPFPCQFKATNCYGRDNHFPLPILPSQHTLLTLATSYCCRTMSDTNDVRIRDFQSSTSRNRSATQAAPNIPRISLDSPSPGPRRYSTLSPSATIRGNISSMERARRASDASSASGSLHRRPTRQDTVRHYHSPSQPNWEVAGGEPGIDTSKDPEAHFDHLMQECQITVVDFSDERMSKYELDNEGLVEFLKDPREDWVACRWINVNGLSWDVIKELGNKHNLHRLAIEDLMNTRGRTKADWYSDHAFSRCFPSLLAGCLYNGIGMYTKGINQTVSIRIVMFGGRENFGKSFGDDVRLRCNHRLSDFGSSHYICDFLIVYLFIAIC